MEVTVLERPGGRIAHELRSRFGSALQRSGIVLNRGLTGVLDRPDLLVAAHWPGAVYPRIRCGILLIDGGSSPDFAHPSFAVSYGMSPRDSITASSVSAPRCVLSLQRELVTVYRRVLERQEFSVTVGDCDVSELLAVMGTALLLELPGIF